jgi:hypothetical protein
LSLETQRAPNGIELCKNEKVGIHPTQVSAMGWIEPVQLRQTQLVTFAGKAAASDEEVSHSSKSKAILKTGSERLKSCYSIVVLPEALGVHRLLLYKLRKQFAADQR